MRLIYLIVVWAAAAAAADNTAIPAITNIKDIAANLKISQFKGKKFRSKIKVAVFDNGFNGYEKELGKTLPKDAVYHKGKESDADKIENTSYHGLLMAQIIHQLVKSGVTAPDYELHLFNSFGYTKLADAVENVIKDKFDLVLYSQVWEFGGNGDGKGFINTLVNKATAAGIVWINAAGNFGKLTRLAKIDGKLEGNDEYVVFQNKKGKTIEGVPVICTPRPKEKTCNLRLVLSWNDFKDDVDTGTDKDLDLILLNSKKKQVGASERNQTLVKDLQNKSSSMIPRELIEQKLEKGTYTARVKIKSKNFSASQDQLRFTAGGAGVSLGESSSGETLLPPADNATVISIGASDDAGNTSKSAKLAKPEISIKSVVRLKDGSSPYSTSTAAAMAAGLATLHLGVDTDSSRDEVLNKLKKIKGAKVEKAKATVEPPAAPKVETPPAPAPKAETPPAPAPKAETPPAPAPKAETPPAPAPKAETPPAPAPKAETPPAPAPKAETPPAPAPKAETPPAPAPKAETPPAPAPKAETPPAPAPKAETKPAPAPAAPAPALPKLETPKAEPEKSSKPKTAVPKAHPKGSNSVGPRVSGSGVGSGSSSKSPATTKQSGGNCLERTTLPNPHSNARKLLQRGGVAVIWKGRPTILVNFNLPKEQNVPVPDGFRVFVYSGGLVTLDPRTSNSFGADYFEILPAYSSPPACR